MTAVFADTSGLLALLNAKDQNHDRAAHAFAALRAKQAMLVTTSFVLVETYALVGRRATRSLPNLRAQLWQSRDLRMEVCASAVVSSTTAVERNRSVNAHLVQASDRSGLGLNRM
jgi:predicted nucleic acid-binding protein